MKLEELSVEQLEEEKRNINMELSKRKHLTYLLKQNEKRTAEILESLKKLWGENWSITMALVSDCSDSDLSLYPSDTIEKSNNFMQELHRLRAERRDIIYKKLHEEKEQ